VIREGEDVARVRLVGCVRHAPGDVRLVITIALPERDLDRFAAVARRVLSSARPAE
jgi:hypothetical protein